MHKTCCAEANAAEINSSALRSPLWLLPCRASPCRVNDVARDLGVVQRLLTNLDVRNLPISNLLGKVGRRKINLNFVPVVGMFGTTV